MYVSPLDGRAELRPFHITGLWAALEERFNLTLIDKESASEMQLIAAALDTLGIVDRDEFLQRYATTVGHHVYLPFELGNAEERPLLSQARTISHEAQHAHRYFTKGKSVWAARYLADPAFRASEEAKAMTTSCEVNYMLTGEVLDPQRRAAGLRAYMLGPRDIRTVAKRLKIMNKTIKAGGVSTAAGKVAREYFSRV